MLVKSVVTIGLQRYLFYLVLDDPKTNLSLEILQRVLCRYLPRVSTTILLQRTLRPCVPTTGYTSRCDTMEGRGQSLLVTLCYGFSTWGFAIFDVGIFYSPRRGETFPPKFHLIPRKFYFSPTWGLFYSYVGICDFPRGDCTFGLMRLWRVTSPTV